MSYLERKYILDPSKKNYFLTTKLVHVRQATICGHETEAV